jgi:Flp pilus assembly protein TadG
MVLVAFMLIVLIGFIGLAVDGGRLYWERRILQNSVDAAALAASDNYQDSQSISSSMHAAAVQYAANEKIYGTASASPSWSASTVDVRWSGSSDDMHVVYTAAGKVSAFDVSSTHQVGLAFIVVLGVGPTANVSALAEGHAKTGGTDSDAIVTLSTQKCTGGSPDSLGTGGSNSIVNVIGGNVVSNGSVGSGSTINVTGGSFSDNCSNPVPSGVTATGGATGGVAPVSDPGFTSGTLSYYPTAQSAGTNLTLQPGTYASDPSTGPAACYFLTPGIYQMSATISNSGTVFSNELRPPDEPTWSSGAPNYNNSVASPQFWTVQSDCSGSFSVAAVTSTPALTTGYWGAVVTSTRTDYYPPQSSGGTAYKRESFPSTCHSVQLLAGQGLQVTVNNVPGATGYNVYFSYSATGLAAACAGPWGYVGGIANGVTETTASRGTVNATFNANLVTLLMSGANVGAACTLGSTYTTGCAAATGSTSANPPGHGAETAPQASGLYPWDPGRDTYANGGGDRANSYDCQPRGTNSSAPCAGAYITPGAVQFVFGATACLTLSGHAGIYAFSGYQYQWITIYASTANTCTPNISGQGGLRLEGAIYWPGGNMTITGNGGAPVASQVLTNTFNAQGNGSLTVSFDFGATPVQGYSQLAQ